jgi:hypothetical protein
MRSIVEARTRSRSLAKPRGERVKIDTERRFPGASFQDAGHLGQRKTDRYGADRASDRGVSQTRPGSEPPELPDPPMNIRASREGSDAIGRGLTRLPIWHRLAHLLWRPPCRCRPRCAQPWSMPGGGGGRGRLRGSACDEWRHGRLVGRSPRTRWGRTLSGWCFRLRRSLIPSSSAGRVSAA